MSRRRSSRRSTRFRARYDHVFTTGGIGPTHDDITADAIAKAFGVPIAVDERAVAMLLERIPKADLNEARLRMARIPKGATLIANSVSKAPGFSIGNVHVMAGVPAIMHAMLDALGPTLAHGRKMLSRSLDAGLKEGDIAAPLGAVQARFPTWPSAAIRASRKARVHHYAGPALTATRCGWRRPKPRCDAVLDDEQRLRLAEALGVRKLISRQRRSLEPAWGRSARRHDAIFAQGTERLLQGTAVGQGISGFVGPVPPRFPGAGVAPVGQGTTWQAIVCVTRGGLVPAAIIARELGIRLIETVCVASYHDYKEQGGLKVLKPIGKDIVDLADGKGAGVLVIDDLVDTGKTAKLVREMVPKCHYATMYAKPAGRPLVDTFITEVSQDTWIYFPWDMGYSFQPPIAQDTAG